MAVDFNHPFVGRIAVYRDPFRDAPEQGPITSVNVEANLVFVRYGSGTTSAATGCDERLTFLDGSPVRFDEPDEEIYHTSDRPSTVREQYEAGWREKQSLR